MRFFIFQLWMDFLKAAFTFTLCYTDNSLSSIVTSKVHRFLWLFVSKERKNVEYNIRLTLRQQNVGTFRCQTFSRSDSTGKPISPIFLYTGTCYQYFWYRYWLSVFTISTVLAIGKLRITTGRLFTLLKEVRHAGRNSEIIWETRKNISLVRSVPVVTTLTCSGMDIDMCHESNNTIQLENTTRK